MNATGVVLRQPLRLCFSSYSTSAAADQSSSRKELRFRTSSASICARQSRRATGILSSGFCDQGQVEYYNSNSGPSSSSPAKRLVATNWDKDKAHRNDKALKMMKKKKKQLKFLKGLSRDVSTFSQMGFGLESDGALVDQVKGNMISEAAEVMLKQLQKLKADRKELKREMKEEKARLKAVRTRDNVFNCEMSSSESSSDGECGEIIDMNNLKSKQAAPQRVNEELTTSPTYPIPILPTVITPAESNPLEGRAYSCNAEKEWCSSEGEVNLSKKIQVCMGGKCKKSGAVALLDEFQRAVGIEGAVSGCKCMGKCRDGPNVRVSNHFGGDLADKSVKADSLCVRVVMEDVEVIVANFLGPNHNQNRVGFAAAC
ncbi:hypothetical protein OROGR_012655 [Orobanche gracilis]